MFSDLVAAVDIGTTNVKIGLFNFSGEKIFLFQQRCFESSRSGVHEVSTEKWWKAVVQGFHSIDSSYRKNIVAICITGQGPTTIMVDERQKVFGKAITWIDKRGFESLKKIIEKGIDGQTATVVAHLIEVEKNLTQKVYLLQPSDFIIMKLTRKIVNASFPQSGYLPWNKEILEKFNLDKKFSIPPLVNTGEVISSIDRSIARVLGVNDKALIIAGAPDFAMALIGTGVLEDGMLCDRGGTSQGLTLCSAKKILHPGLITTPFFLDDYWKISGVMTTTGGAYEWFSRQVARTRLVNLARLMQIKRPTGVIFLPHLNGERSPYWNPSLRGAFFGLSFNDDWKTMLVSVVEGVAYAIREIVELMKKSGCDIKTIRTTGGQSLNDLWNQTKSDVLGKELEVVNVHESELLGCAIVAISSLSKESFLQISKKIVRVSRKFLPCMDKHEVYSRLFELYQLIHRRNEDIFEKLTKSL
ncbi:xylulokinase [Pseudothermotoga lettingae]|uniref:Carbohydrate kinase FGGY n=1 Tax=Pseudothermotoga lettingae (strain ATCC BAA-301 / DSM 14385 / NBRC 107922 / TMO) TaxID=416591 RepID=A8F425_PSELT|nr:FGGY-family carbohydrate kinase [Pseudothermotoga lettingae]ABV32909.1 carbohydrate kinase FGGY [Pseudothermotoga lettingae TMO]GLI48092.1 xylulokinase [Pseudothermotoga lettingae TMO]